MTAFSLVRDDLAYRLQRRVGLIPADGLGVVRRALFWALVSWAPIAMAAWLAHRFTGPGESLMSHYGVHVRLLLAVPLLVLAEATAQAQTACLLPHLVASGIVPPGRVAAFHDVLRDRTLPWIMILALVVSGVAVSDLRQRPHEVD